MSIGFLFLPDKKLVMIGCASCPVLTWTCSFMQIRGDTETSHLMALPSELNAVSRGVEVQASAVYHGVEQDICHAPPTTDDSMYMG